MQTTQSCFCFGFLQPVTPGMPCRGGHGRLTHTLCYFHRGASPPWSSPGLKHTLKSPGHLPSFFQSSSSIRPWSGCSWSFITYQTLEWVQLVILPPLSPSLLCPAPTKTFQWQQHSGVAAWDQGSLALLPVLVLGDGSTNLNPALTPFLLPIPSAWHTRGKCSSSCHNTLAWMHLLDRNAMQLLKSWKDFIESTSGSSCQNKHSIEIFVK